MNIEDAPLADILDFLACSRSGWAVLAKFSTELAQIDLTHIDHNLHEDALVAAECGYDVRNDLLGVTKRMVNVVSVNRHPAPLAELFTNSFLVKSELKSRLIEIIMLESDMGPNQLTKLEKQHERLFSSRV